MKTRLVNIVNRIKQVDRLALLLTLNLFALGIFFFIGLRYNYLHPDNIGRLMFSTPDTWKYRAIADWLFGKTRELSSQPALPFLYPLFLGSVRQITDNPYVLWASQFCLWVASINLTSLSVYRLTKRKMLMTIAFCIMMVNISALVLTFYALPETVVIFVWSIWLFVVSRTNLSDPNPHDVFLLMFLLSLLAITKPVFQLHLLLFLAYVLFKGIRRYGMILLVFLAILPVVIQIIVNADLLGLIGISNISEYTMKLYLLPQVYATGNAISLQNARDAVKDFDTIQTAFYLIQNPVSAASAFLQNLKENMTGASEVLGFYAKPYTFTHLTNYVYLFVQIVFLPIVSYVFLVKKGPLLLAIKLMYAFSLLVILTSGISFNEGDRLVISALPLWMVIYLSLPILFFDRTDANETVAPSQ